MGAVKYRVVSRRLVGCAEGDIISGDGLQKLGHDPLHAAISGHVVAVPDYDEPKKHKGARKDASDADKD